MASNSALIAEISPANSSFKGDGMTNELLIRFSFLRFSLETSTLSKEEAIRARSNASN